MKRINKKGMQWTAWLSVALGIGGGIIFIAVMAIVLAAFGSSTTDANATAIINNGKTFLYNLTNSLGTVGTVGGVLLLVGLLALAGFGGYSMYRKNQ